MTLARLGLPPATDEQELKQYWRKLASEHHPDRGGDGSEFNRLRLLYEAALEEVREPKMCGRCNGGGRVLALSGWSSIKLCCPDCGGDGVQK